VIKNFQELVASLKGAGVTCRADEAEQVFEARLQAPPLDSVIFGRWEKTLPLLHLLCPLVDGISDERLADVETAVCRANNVAVVPGFGIDYGKRAVYFRVSQPLLNGISSAALDAQFEIVMSHARDYFTSFVDVVRKGSPGEGIIDLAEAWVAADRAAAPAH
jgi:hypothetical protein